jgi:hypothetical protein
MTTYYKGYIGKEDIEFGIGTFLRKDKDHASVQLNQVNLSHVPRYVLAKTASYQILDSTEECTFTNEGAVTVVRFTLPNAASGKGPYDFIVISDTALFIVDPKGTDYFRDCAAGKYKATQIVGNTLTVWCNTSGIWDWDYNLVSGNWDNES